MTNRVRALVTIEDFIKISDSKDEYFNFINEKNKSGEYIDNDIRLITIFDIYLTLLITLSSIRLHIEWEKEIKQNKKTITNILGIGVSALSIDPAMEVADEYYFEDRLFTTGLVSEQVKLIDLLYFKIDDCISHIVDALTLKNEKSLTKNFKNINKYLYKTESIPESIGCLMYMRNTLHKSMVHMGEDKPFVINGQKFEFKKNKKVPFNFRILGILLDGILEDMKNLFAHPEIKKIKTIPANYIQAIGGFIN